jgi:hypothetical protein
MYQVPPRSLLLPHCLEDQLLCKQSGSTFFIFWFFSFFSLPLLTHCHVFMF